MTREYLYFFAKHRHRLMNMPFMEIIAASLMTRVNISSLANRDSNAIVSSSNFSFSTTSHESLSSADQMQCVFKDIIFKLVDSGKDLLQQQHLFTDFPSNKNIALKTVEDRARMPETDHP